MLEGYWYVAAQSHRVKFGSPTAAVLLERPLVLVRDESGTVHALEDHCAHRGVPLSAGWQEGDSIRCRYHGWRYNFSGACVEVPVLGKGSSAAAKSPCVQSFRVQEQDGWVWVYASHERFPKPSTPPPKFPAPSVPSRVSLLRMSLPVKARMDLAVDNFIDPAHVPYVHHGLFRQRHVPREKEKEFTRLPEGFRTVSNNVHLPNTIVFRVLNPRLTPARTTIDFLMPGIHVETFEVGTRWGAIMVVVTPIAERAARLDFTMGWNFLHWAFPLVWLARIIAQKALKQDRAIVELQELGHRHSTAMSLSLDSDTMAVWYRRLQKYHADQLAGAPNLTHPVPERTTLRWIT